MCFYTAGSLNKTATVMSCITNRANKCTVIPWLTSDPANEFFG